MLWKSCTQYASKFGKLSSGHRTGKGQFSPQSPRSEVKWKSLSHVQLFATPWTTSPWNSPGQNTGWGSLSLLQGIFLSQELNRGLLHCRWILYQLSYEERSQRKPKPKNVQTIVQLHSFHILARKSSKSYKLNFSSTWTENFWMYELCFKNGEEPEIKLPTSTGSQRKKGNSRKTSTSVSLNTLMPLTVWITTNSGKFWKRQEYPTALAVSWEICMQVKKQQLKTKHGTMDWFKIGKGVHQGYLF